MSQPDYLTSLEQDVLRVLLSLTGGDAPCIREKLIETVRQDYSLRSIYAVLKCLEECGFVVSRDSPLGNQRGGKKQLFFSVTPKGQAALEAFLNYLDAIRARAHMGGRFT